MIRSKIREIRTNLFSKRHHAKASPIGLSPVYDVDMSWKLAQMSPSRDVSIDSLGRLPFRSEMCTEYHFYLDLYQYWCSVIKEEPRLHRKQWEFVYIMHALWERGLLQSSKRGIGFGVGKEPLVSYFASVGCTVLATDLGLTQATELGWTDSNQRTKSLDGLNERGICPPDSFEQLVRFQDVDMNQIPADIKEYDFCWSACCLEHLGSIEHGAKFIANSLNTLKVGGWAIHTTELNLTSNKHTIDNAGTVIFRKQDVEHVIATVRQQGHYVEPLILHNGYVVDRFVDLPPYRDEPHLRLQLDRYASTSVGLIIQRQA